MGDPPAIDRQASLRNRHASPTLRSELETLIDSEGPLNVAQYMALALGHPTLGYYTTRDPFGIAGDFTTAPEISQMFGELIGLWAAEVWHGLGRPSPVRLVELGPGRGTLMRDALRAARALPAFRAALDMHLVEMSPVLRDAQERTLASQGCRATWHDSVFTVPEGPALFIANEFFDALPVRQFQRTERGWCERFVGLDRSGRLAFGLGAEPEPRLSAPAPRGSVVEIGSEALDVMHYLCQHVRQWDGAVLAIDYGSVTAGYGDTLQAVKAHRFVDPLAEPGTADLTAHVDFAALARTASMAGSAVHGPVTQGEFLRSLGIAHRAEGLKQLASPSQAEAIDGALDRLTGPEPGMGDLFKVLAITRPGLTAPPGFESELPL